MSWNGHLTIFSVTRYTQPIPVYSVSQELIQIIALQSILMKSWMIGKTFVRTHYMAWLCVTAVNKVNIIKVIDSPSVLKVLAIVLEIERETFFSVLYDKSSWFFHR